MFLCLFSFVSTVDKVGAGDVLDVTVVVLIVGDVIVAVVTVVVSGVTVDVVVTGAITVDDVVVVVVSAVTTGTNAGGVTETGVNLKLFMINS